MLDGMREGLLLRFLSRFYLDLRLYRSQIWRLSRPLPILTTAVFAATTAHTAYKDLKL